MSLTFLRVSTTRIRCNPTQTRRRLCRKRSMKKVKNVYTCAYRKKGNNAVLKIYICVRGASALHMLRNVSCVAMRFTRPDLTRPDLKIFWIVQHSMSVDAENFVTRSTETRRASDRFLDFTILSITRPSVDFSSEMFSILNQ